MRTLLEICNSYFEHQTEHQGISYTLDYFGDYIANELTKESGFYEFFATSDAKYREIRLFWLKPHRVEQPLYKSWGYVTSTRQILLKIKVSLAKGSTHHSAYFYETTQYYKVKDFEKPIDMNRTASELVDACRARLYEARKAKEAKENNENAKALEMLKDNGFESFADFQNSLVNYFEILSKMGGATRREFINKLNEETENKLGWSKRITVRG